MNLAIIGGTGAVDLFEADRPAAITTPFGAPSDRPRRIRLGNDDAWFLSRHGTPHRIPPHKVNYRANIHALKTLGVEAVLAINAVGGLTERAAAGALLIPDQLLDFTWGRTHTFSDGGSAPLQHIDFTHPFDGPLRDALCRACKARDADVVAGGCIAVTQGPRLETAAEVRHLAHLGCDVVGMTTMPEAALAREAGLDYASLCVVANAGAGLEDRPITVGDIERVLSGAMERVRGLLQTIPGEIAAES
ncbi:MAG: S-methyl-5'-thioinosine phosphorylase [Candidatus Wenzhouxiangella sp. M2_3B_020]